MHFIFAQTVNDMAAGILQSAGHFNVVGFIKPRPQLYQNNNFLAVFRGFNQGINNLASFCHTIQGHLDRNNLFVLRSLMQHTQEWLDALKGIGQQHILFSNLIENTFL